MSVRYLAPAVLLSVLSVAGCTENTATEVKPNVPLLITYGSPTGVGHPEVVLIVMDVKGAPAYRCSGTLLSPTRVLTAGHCTGAPGEFTGMRIFTESDVQHGTNNYPNAGANTVEAKAWYTHPEYTKAPFFVNDVGVIELAAPVNVPAADYGRLPTLNSLDELRPGTRSPFTSVGYGLQRINPVFVVAEKVRMLATPNLVQINTGFVGSRSLLLSNNASTGGTCFGDSGGPNFVGSGNVIGGVTSFGINGNCAGTGGVFRLDRADVLTFVTSHLQ